MTVYPCTKKWKRSVNLPFTKNLNRSEHHSHTQHHFPKTNSSRRCQQTPFSSTVKFGNEIKLKSRMPPFSLICIQCERMFCFQFRIVFCIWVNSDTRWQTRHIGLFQILCPLSIDRQWSLIRLARYKISDQTDYSSRYGFARIWFK